MIHNKLKTIRKQRGLTQEQMAKIIATDTSNYSRKEKGDVKIHDDEWQKLADALDVPLDDLKEKEINFSFQYDNSTFHDHSGSNINYYNIPDSFIKHLQDYIELLKKEIENLKK